ncbi:hypothetical protein JHK84_044912 [Glycine max]|uniref:Uncharacterized protein n=1 Tax=Glycine soja TaxID=3848 RepID=A0A0B2QUC7_GLYSO|nr:hypothetical protein JHK86_044802 [Glycine max]KAG4951551.1 hypothetical protein JHK85_045418 [Glycine max]KAG5108005.1 hypothetical protein JHK84_044912 [Glycine max]KHN25145.1 hypothetical protein glysoja_038694 [Glycine soja]
MGISKAQRNLRILNMTSENVDWKLRVGLEFESIEFGNDDGLIREGQSEVDDANLDLCYTYDCCLITMEGITYAQQGDLNTCCLVFLSETVVWTRLGYFPMNGTILHLRVEVKHKHRIEHD